MMRLLRLPRLLVDLGLVLIVLTVVAAITRRRPVARRFCRPLKSWADERADTCLDGFLSRNRE